MPDKTAIDMNPPPPPGPALSATSDAPLKQQEPPVSAVGNAQGGEKEAPKAVTEPTDKEIAQPKTGEETGDAGDPAADNQTDADKGGKKTMSARMSELAQARKAAEKRADDLAAALKIMAENQQQGVTTSTKTADDPRPSRDKFENPDDYDGALIEWSARQATKVAQAETRKALETEKVKETQTKIVEEWNKKAAKAAEKYPDFNEVAFSDDVSITIAMSHVILTAENGDDLVYHLGKNPEEAARIAALPVAQQGFAMGQLASKIGKSTVSKAPDPMKRVGSNAAASGKTANDESMEEYAARRNKEAGGRLR